MLPNIQQPQKHRVNRATNYRVAVPLLTKQQVQSSRYNEHGLNNPWFSDIQSVVKPDPVFLEELTIPIEEENAKKNVKNASLSNANKINDTKKNFGKKKKSSVGFVQILPRRYTRRPYIKGKYILRKVDNVNLPLPRPINMNVLLWHSAANGDKQGCRDAMMNGASIDWRHETFSDDKYTPFLIAVRNGHMNCLRFFWEECSNLNLKSAPT